MTISVKLLNDHVKKISETNSLLDMLLEFEKTLDSLNLYAFKNWLKGEILEGPTLKRHYVNIKLLYPYKDMPDPDGAKRLIARDCLVEYKCVMILSYSNLRVLKISICLIDFTYSIFSSIVFKLLYSSNISFFVGIFSLIIGIAYTIFNQMSTKKCSHSALFLYKKLWNTRVFYM